MTKTESADNDRHGGDRKPHRCRRAMRSSGRTRTTKAPSISAWHLDPTPTTTRVGTRSRRGSQSSPTARIGVKFYYNNALGGEREVVEGMSINSIQMGMASTGPMGGFVSDPSCSSTCRTSSRTRSTCTRCSTGRSGRSGRRVPRDDQRADPVVDRTTASATTNSQLPIETPEDLNGIKHPPRRTPRRSTHGALWGRTRSPWRGRRSTPHSSRGSSTVRRTRLQRLRMCGYIEVEKYIAMTVWCYSPASDDDLRTVLRDVLAMRIRKRSRSCR